jgi:UDP-2,3-diacylglucosamine pyrophosphatase LpxH
VSPDFSRANHTIILSDVHLADAEPPHPRNPLWKRFKRPKYFIDRSFRALLEHLHREIQEPIELVLNGDIFDFDSVMTIPEDGGFKTNWLERLRGLRAEEDKSEFKMGVILKDHFVWVEALQDFLRRGHRLVFVIGNHDVELHWPRVQERLLQTLTPDGTHRAQVRICEWFYVSNRDTLIEHGNQYDDLCICSDPIHPLIKKHGKIFVRIPFGNLAGKYMTNGMGLMNPHVESSFIKESFWEYVVFFYRYMVRVQPLIVYSWFWSAMATMLMSVREGLLPALKDPLTKEQRIREIAYRSNAAPRVVRSLRELHVHPAIFDPLKILRVLWLDRALLLILAALVLFQFFALVNVIFGVSFFWWYVIPLLAVLPLFIFYARSVETDLLKAEVLMRDTVPYAAKVARVNRVVHGHSHREQHTWVGDIELMNPGTWSPAFEDPECTQPFGRKCFVWIHPLAGERFRKAELLEWTGDEARRIAPTRS